MTTKLPPAYPTTKNPAAIIGHHNMFLFKKHLAIAFSSTNGGDFPTGRLNKEFTKNEREQIGAVLSVLRSLGFVPAGFNDNGSVRWKIITKSPCDVEFDKGLPELEKKTKEELRQIALVGFKKFIKDCEG